MLKTALSQYGIREFPGDSHNPEVLKYFEILGYDFSDEFAWCSAFLNWCALKSNNEHTGKLDARSWLKVGVETDEPHIGDVVIFSRGDPKSWKGHCGLFIRDDFINVWTLGGNQNNMVCIKAYDRKRLLGYRKLRIVEG